MGAFQFRETKGDILFNLVRNKNTTPMTHRDDNDDDDDYGNNNNNNNNSK